MADDFLSPKVTSRFLILGIALTAACSAPSSSTTPDAGVAEPDVQEAEATVPDAPPTTPPWARALGGTALFAPRVGFDAEQNVIVAFTPDGTPRDFGDGEFRCGKGDDSTLVAKFSRHGAFQWKRCINGSAMRDAGLAIGPSGDVMILSTVGSTVGKDYQANELRIDKLSNSGSILWTKTLDGYYVEGGSLAVDATGNIVFSGRSYGPIDFGAGPVGEHENLVFVARLDRDGSLQWVRNVGARCRSCLTPKVAAGPAGTVAVSGAVVPDDVQGDTVNLGGSDLRFRGGGAYIAMLDANGKQMWATALEGWIHPDIEDVAAAADGTVAIAAETDGSVTMPDGSITATKSKSKAFIAEFKSDGSYRFARTWDRFLPYQGGGGYYPPPPDPPLPSAGIAFSLTGDLAVASSTLIQPPDPPLSRLFFDRFDRAGSVRLSRESILKADDAFGTAVAFGPAQKDAAQPVALAGIFHHEIQFAFATLTDEASKYPAFVADFGP